MRYKLLSLRVLGYDNNSYCKKKESLRVLGYDNYSYSKKKNKRPWRWRSWLESLLPMRKVAFSNPDRNGSKLLNLVITVPLPNAQQ